MLINRIYGTQKREIALIPQLESWSYQILSCLTTLLMSTAQIVAFLYLSN